MSLSRQLVGDVVLDVPEFSGQFSCSPRSDLFLRIATSGAYEPGLVELLKRHIDPARDFVDVGANLGFYSVLAAKLCPGRRVLAIEPSPAALLRLRENLRRNQTRDATLVEEVALSDCDGASDLSLIEGMEEYSSLGPIIHCSVAGQKRRTIKVRTATLDGLVSGHRINPGLIKIDVEGAEFKVLNGAMETLRQHRPVVISELSPALLEPMGTSADAVLETYRSLGYRVFDALDPGIVPGRRPYGDILCLPE